MKLFFMLLVFASTTLLGVCAVNVGALGDAFLVLPKIDLLVFDPTESRSIDIAYAGFRSEAQDIGTVSLIFIIKNRTHEPITYVGYSREHSFPLIKFDGVMRPSAYVCSRGASEYTIQPGSSAKVLVAREEFLDETPSGAAVTVGFNLRSVPETRSTAYFSRPFALPEGFLLRTRPSMGGVTLSR